MTPRIHPNRHRGEIAACLDGETRLLCLTLGALAELESAFEVSDLSELADRFQSGRLSAQDIVRIIGAGLRGAGNRVDDEDVAAMSTEGGIAGFASIAAQLLWATFAQTPPGRTPPGHSPEQVLDREGESRPSAPQAATR